MIYFNDKRLCIGQIKQLLHSFNLPQCRVYKDGMEFAEGDTYIRDGFIYSVTKEIKRDKTGNPVLDPVTKSYVYVSDNLVHNRVRPYKLGDKIENLTKTLDLRNNYYDNHTHNYLGDYLRFIRDYTGVNMMSMYNCFGYEVPSNFKYSVQFHIPYTPTLIEPPLILLGSESSVSQGQLVVGRDASLNPDNRTLEFNDIVGATDTIVNIDFDSSSEEYNVYCLSVRFGNEYTIAIDCSSAIEIFCGFYDNGNHITCPKFAEGEIEAATYAKHSTNIFVHPFVYDKLTKITPCYSHEKNLRMFIKVPVGCTSSIVVMEGNYIKDTEMYIKGDNRALKQVLCGDTLKYIGNEIFDNREYLSKRQLLSYSTKGKFLLADRLVEYLTNQVISPIDTTTNNVKRAQSQILNLNDKGVGTVIAPDGKEYSYSLGRPFDFYGIWDDKTTNAIYDFARLAGFRDNYKDLLYYVDKDIETNMGGLPINIDTVDWSNK